MSDNENQELIIYRFSKALETMEEVNILRQSQLWNVSINRLYYSCYYAVGALLASVRVYPKTHSGANQMLGLHFVKPGNFSADEHSFFTKLFNMRQEADYEDFVDYEEKDLLPLIQPAKDFIAHIQEHLTPFLK